MANVEVNERCPGSEMRADHRLQQEAWPAAIAKRKRPPKYGVAACLSCKKAFALDEFGRYPGHVRKATVVVRK